MNPSNPGLQSLVDLKESDDNLPIRSLMIRRHNRSHHRTSSIGAFAGASTKFDQIIFPGLGFCNITGSNSTIPFLEHSGKSKKKAVKSVKLVLKEADSSEEGPLQQESCK